MDHKEVLKRVDHTLLTQAATWEEAKNVQRSFALN